MQINFENSNHSFEKLDIFQNKECLEWALTTAYEKTNNTVDTWLKRDKIKRFQDIFWGDLAKNLLKKYLISQFPKLEHNIIEYDKIRADDFKNSDKFDLMIYWNDKRYNIEVKSSCEKYTKKLEDILNKRRMMINLNNSHEHFEWNLVQFYFVPENLNFFKQQFKEKDFEDFEDFYSFFKEELSEQLSKQKIEVYICGYATKQMQIDAAQRDTFGLENREYANFYIKDSRPICTFGREIKKILSEDRTDEKNKSDFEIIFGK